MANDRVADRLENLELVSQHEPTLEAVTTAVFDMPPCETAAEPEPARDALTDPVVHGAVELAMVAELPAPCTIGVDGGAAIATGAFAGATLDQHLLRLARPLELNQSRWLTIARSFARAEVIAAKDSIPGQLRRNLRALLPLYEFIAWSSDNDHISMRTQLRERAAIKQRRGLSARDRVRITSGVFAGRVGEIQAIDSRGRAKVLVGRIPIVVEADAVDKL